MIIEHLNFYPNKELLEEFIQKGGIVIKPNRIEKIFNHALNFELQNFFNRCHQKLSLIDKDLFIGSSNIAKEYSNIKYGSFEFVDLNSYIKNTINYKSVLSMFQYYLINNLDEIKLFNYKSYLNVLHSINSKLYSNFRHFSYCNALYDRSYFKNFFKYNSLDNFKIISKVNILEPKQFQSDSSVERFLLEQPPQISDIQNNIYELIKNAKNNIVIVQPYYLRINKIDNLLIEAKKRGVNVTIITAYNRDQPAYKHLYNKELFNHLIKENITVLEYMHKYLHMKSYYIDNKILSFGSMNNDITSFQMNNEANYLINKTNTNSYSFDEFECILENLKKNCRDVSQNNSQFNMFRYISNKWWYFFIWTMQKTVSLRKLD